jgi:hypothetical protein
LIFYKAIETVILVTSEEEVSSQSDNELEVSLYKLATPPQSNPLATPPHSNPSSPARPSTPLQTNELRRSKRLRKE